MADTKIHVKDTHVTYVFTIIDQDSNITDVTNASSVTFVVRPEQDDEATKACAINPAVDSGSNGTTTGSTLTEAGQNFTSTVDVGDLIVITEGNDLGSYVVTEVTSDTTLTVAETFVGDTGKAWYVTDGTVTLIPSANLFDHGDQSARLKITWGDTTVSYTITDFVVKGLH